MNLSKKQFIQNIKRIAEHKKKLEWLIKGDKRKILTLDDIGEPPIELPIKR